MITTILFIIGIYLWIISGILGYGIIFYYLEQTNPPYTLGELCYNKSIARICLITAGDLPLRWLLTTVFKIDLSEAKIVTRSSEYK